MFRLLRSLLQGFLLATYVSNPILESSKTASTTLVINEVDYDQPGVDYAEFIEILNIGATDILLSDYEIWLVSSKGSIYNQFSLLNISLSLGDYFIICSTNPNHVLPCNQSQKADSSQSDRSINLIRNEPGGSVVLVKPNTIVDAVTFGKVGTDSSYYTETSPSISDSRIEPNVSVGRCPDGISTFNNSHDFCRSKSSPGNANICPGTNTSSPKLPSPSSPTLSTSFPFDFFLLSTQWPGSWTSSFCSDRQYGWNTSNPMWTIHGLWPNNFSGSYPTYCDPNSWFNESMLNSNGLLQDMIQFWPSYACSDKTFWKHEWLKHGTCAEFLFSSDRMNNNFSTEFNYFDFTTRLLFLSIPNPYTVLRNNGIVPGGTYSSKDIMSAIQSDLGIDLVELHCTTASAISEIRFCVSLNLTIISCNSTWLGQTSCGNSIYYPLCNNTGASC